jgi:hypothetical protein
VLSRVKIHLALFAALLAVFVLGLLHLFQLRFETGDIYPPYSSLRADPLGTRAFFEALSELPGLSVRRHFREPDKLGEGRGATVFFFGVTPEQLRAVPESEAKALETFMAQGGRVVISFLPVNRKPVSGAGEEARRGKKDRPGQDGEPEQTEPRRRAIPGPDEEDDAAFKVVSLQERWSVRLAYGTLPRNEEDRFEPVAALRSVDRADLPGELTWHTSLYFENLGPGWTNVYEWEARPVLIEKQFGRGALVLSADSFYLSNEALVNERHSGLLGWLAGPNRTLIFDEAHLGVIEAPGIATLIRKYRLHGVVLGFVLLAGLFVWKNVAGLVPPHEAPHGSDEAVVEGKDSASAFINLLRRNLAAAEILRVCHAEWSRSARPTFQNAEKTERIRNLVEAESAKPSRQRDPVGAYRRIARILAERN